MFIVFCKFHFMISVWICLKVIKQKWIHLNLHFGWWTKFKTQREHAQSVILQPKKRDVSHAPAVYCLKQCAKISLKSVSAHTHPLQEPASKFPHSSSFCPQGTEMSQQEMNTDNLLNTEYVFYWEQVSMRCNVTSMFIQTNWI